jgi:NAD(P)-dependent dehydrogenase (short-subunit alcohol dehydrogenase family)
MYLKKISFKKKVVLITGAGKGLGKACALAMAEAGAHVIAISRTIKDLNNLEKLIRKTKGNITKIICDVTNYNELSLSINKIKKIDILVNNAGTNIPELFKDVKQQSLNRLIDLNLKAAFNVAQLVVKKMLKNKTKDAAIVHLSSQLGHVSMEGRSVYSMTKFGIEGLTRGMALELAKNNIRVNAVCPTYVETPLVKKVFKNKKFKKLVLSRIPMGKPATESDIATAICFLASSAASMITGTSLLVDGGWTAQ